MSNKWLISCEHGGNSIPEAYKTHFRDAEEVLKTHRGWDPGALQLFKQLEELSDFSLSSTNSRLLVELNRSLHHPKLFSEFTKGLSMPEKEEVLKHYYRPYRNKIEQAVKAYIDDKKNVYHLSMHSFTPVMDGQTRNADIGLLFDPKNQMEKALCQQWKTLLAKELPDFRIRFNYPYKGTADGFTTYLRRKFPNAYAGIEFELNQQWANEAEVYEKIYTTVVQLKQIK